MSELGQKIRQARKAKGWSLKIFSEKIGISIMTLQRIETGQVSPSVRLMVDIAYHLGRPITDFVQDKERTLIRLKANRLKTKDMKSVHYRSIFPDGVIDEKLGLDLLDLDPGGETEWETSDYYKGYNLLSGEAALEFEDKKVKFKKGEAVYFDARFSHRLTTKDGARAVVVHRR